MTQRTMNQMNVLFEKAVENKLTATESKLLQNLYANYIDEGRTTPKANNVFPPLKVA